MKLINLLNDSTMEQGGVIFSHQVRLVWSVLFLINQLKTFKQVFFGYVHTAGFDSQFQFFTEICKKLHSHSFYQSVKGL